MVHQEEGSDALANLPSRATRFPARGCGQFGNDTGRAAVGLVASAMEVFFMPDVFSDRADERLKAFVDPWSHQPPHQGDIPDHAVFAGAWHLDVGIDTIHEALFLARDDHGTGCGR
jgi:hypothetical protein